MHNVRRLRNSNLTLDDLKEIKCVFWRLCTAPQAYSVVRRPCERLSYVCGLLSFASCPSNRRSPQRHGDDAWGVPVPERNDAHDSGLRRCCASQRGHPHSKCVRLERWRKTEEADGAAHARITSCVASGTPVCDKCRLFRITFLSCRAAAVFAIFGIIAFGLTNRRGPPCPRDISCR